MHHLQALAAAQDVLTRSDASATDLATLIARVLSPYDVASQRIVVRPGPPVPIEARYATSIALGLGELATNAIKHGAPANDEGVVPIEWNVRRRQDASVLALSWRERGGPRIAQVRPEGGFGTTLFERLLCRDPKTECRYALEPSGARFDLFLKLA